MWNHCLLPLLSPYLNTQPIYHAFLNDYITHLNVEGRPGGPPGHMDGPPGLENCQWELNNKGNGNADHSYCKSVKQITLTKSLATLVPYIDHFIKQICKTSLTMATCPGLWISLPSASTISFSDMVEPHPLPDYKKKYTIRGYIHLCALEVKHHA